MHGHRDIRWTAAAEMSMINLMEEAAEHELVSKEFDALRRHLKKERKSIFSNGSSMEKSQLCKLCCKTKAPLWC